MANHPNRGHRVTPPPSRTTAEDDRDEVCVEALEPHVTRLVFRAEAAGWTRPEIIVALLSLCVSEMRIGGGDRVTRETLTAAIMHLDE